MVSKIAGAASEAAMLMELELMRQRAERDVQVAFSMFVRAHGLPDGVTFHGVQGETVLVGNVPEEPASNG